MELHSVIAELTRQLEERAREKIEEDDEEEDEDERTAEGHDVEDGASGTSTPTSGAKAKAEERMNLLNELASRTSTDIIDAEAVEVNRFFFSL